MVQKFYHVHIARSIAKHPGWTYETNMSKKQILHNFVAPFLNGGEIICNGVVFQRSEIEVFRIYVTTNKVLETTEYQNFNVDSEINKNGKDVTREIMEEGKKYQIEKEVTVRSDQIFIVHGHDSKSKIELARMIENDFGLEAIILHEQPNKGNTLIEKFERVSERPGYAFVLLTPDDKGGEKGSKVANLNNRARQNVILELGYFLGRLGRGRVCCLYTGGVEIPSDFSGVLYLEFTKNIDERYREIRRELRSAGYELKK